MDVCVGNIIFVINPKSYCISSRCFGVIQSDVIITFCFRDIIRIRVGGRSVVLCTPVRRRAEGALVRSAALTHCILYLQLTELTGITCLLCNVGAPFVLPSIRGFDLASPTPFSQ